MKNGDAAPLRRHQLDPTQPVGMGATEQSKTSGDADANNVWFLTDAGNIYKKN